MKGCFEVSDNKRTTISIQITHCADECSRDALGDMLLIMYKCRSSQKQKTWQFQIKISDCHTFQYNYFWRSSNFQAICETNQTMAYGLDGTGTLQVHWLFLP